MIAEARLRAAAAGIVNATFEQADAQVHPFALGAADVVMSKFGAMFFADGCGVHEPGARTPARRPPRCSGGGLGDNDWMRLVRRRWRRAAICPCLPRGRRGRSAPPTRRATAPSWKAPASSTSRTSSCTSRLRPATPPTTFEFVSSSSLGRGLLSGVDPDTHERDTGAAHGDRRARDPRRGVLAPSAGW